MVEDVESLETELKRLGFCEGHGLQQGHVIVDDARAVEEPAFGITRLSQRLKTEETSVEIALAVTRVVIQCEPTRSVLRFVDAIVVHPVRFRAQQGIVAVIVERDGKSSTEAGNPGNRPALGPAVGSAEKSIEGELVVVAHHEVLLHVEGGKSLAQRGIDRVDLFSKIGSLI